MEVKKSKNVKITYDLINSAYTQLITTIDTNNINTITIIEIIKKTMLISEEMLITSKTYKVELTLFVLRKLIDKHIDFPNNDVLNSIIEYTVPTMMNLLTSRNIFKRCFSC